MPTGFARPTFFFHRRYPQALLVVFAAVFLLFAIRPLDVFDFWLENMIVLPFVALLVVSRRRFPLSNISYTLILTYLVIHEVGAHYKYDVPIDWESLGSERDHYDRLVHFSFGLFMAYPIREMFHRLARTRGLWSYYLPLDVTLSFSAVYEIIEWAATLVVSREAGLNFVGAQGDEWDAIKDMGLAGLGALITMTTTMVIAYRNNPRFRDEFKSSFQPELDEPMGEVLLERWRREKGP
ncbi:MAG: DUF2238 domain-containing protein [Euryarchaeota archaeon]|nr:DUF2238 domain-containing protein [Euryarchaeota archaeon]